MRKKYKLKKEIYCGCPDCVHFSTLPYVYIDPTNNTRRRLIDENGQISLCSYSLVNDLIEIQEYEITLDDGLFEL